MRTAASAGESDRLSGYVDFPAVRESVKSQMLAMLTKQMQGDSMKSNPFATLGIALAGGMVNTIVEGMVTPEGVANMVRSGNPKPAELKAVTAAQPQPDQESRNDHEKPPRIERHYEGLGVFKLEMRDPETDELMMAFVLNREGWFEWKLKAIRMPFLYGS